MSHPNAIVTFGSLATTELCWYDGNCGTPVEITAETVSAKWET